MLLCKNLEQSFESVVAIEPKFVTTETDPNALKLRQQAILFHY